MFKSNSLFLLFLLAIGLPCLSQNKIRADLELNFFPPSKAEKKITMFPLKTMVEETLYLENYGSDTVRMNIENMSLPVSGFFYPSLHVSASCENGQIADLPHTFMGQSLKFPVPASFCKIVLTYEFQSDYFYKGGFQNIEYLVPYIYDWTSWYFTCEGLTVDRVRFNVPDSQYFFANLPMEKKDGAFMLNTGKLKGNDISFYLLAKQYYDYSECKSGNVEIAVCQTKGSVPREDLKRYVPGVNSPSYLKAHVDVVKDAVKSVTGFLECHSPMKLSVADKRLSDCEKVIWGNTTLISDREAFVLIDSTMWDDNSLYHELIHVFDRNVLNNTSQSDSARFFFTESLVEYISVYLRYKDVKVRNEIFDEKMLIYSKSKELNSSIFGLESNRLNGADGSGGSYVIYQKTPFVIHSFARRIGEKRFIEIFKDFYREARASGKVSMGDFESTAKRHGVTDEEWKWFMKYL